MYILNLLTLMLTSQDNPCGFAWFIPILLNINPLSVVAHTSLLPTLTCLKEVVLDSMPGTI